MKSKFNLLISTVMITLCQFNAHAQSGGIGGGKISEQNLKALMLELIPYFASEEGKREFPMLVEYDRTHPDATIAKLLTHTDVKLEDGPQYDAFDEDRDCVSNYSNPMKRFFKCNQNMLPSYTLENQPALSRFVFHEILVQAGLERALDADVNSRYHISAKLQFHLETIQKWIPGKGKEKRVYRANSISNCAKLLALDVLNRHSLHPQGSLKLSHFRILDVIDPKDRALISELYNMRLNEIGSLTEAERERRDFNKTLKISSTLKQGRSAAHFNFSAKDVYDFTQNLVISVTSRFKNNPGSAVNEQVSCYLIDASVREVNSDFNDIVFDETQKNPLENTK